MCGLASLIGAETEAQLLGLNTILHRKHKFIVIFLYHIILMVRFLDRVFPSEAKSPL